MELAILYDEAFLGHVCRGAHPERPERLLSCRQALERAGLWQAAHILPARTATIEELARVHERSYVERTLAAIDGRWGYADGDTYFCPGTRRAALGAAGGSIDLVRRVARGDADVGLGLVRPPGHHAEPDAAAGFCLFNNVAVAAAALLEDGLERVAIFDWDVHHGNGTQHEFERDGRVLYVSVHQWPHYPSTGQSAEIGEGPGRGFTANVPYPAGATDADYAALVDRLLVPLVRGFRPEIVLVSAGFDAHGADPLAGMRLSEAGYAYMAAAVRDLARELCSGRVVVLLEGGYDLGALGASLVATVQALGGADAPRPAGEPGEEHRQRLDETRAALAPHWSELGGEPTG